MDMPSEEIQANFLKRGYVIIDNGNGTLTLQPTSDKVSEICAKNKAIGIQQKARWDRLLK